MKSETAYKIARGCNDQDIQKWSSGIGRFVDTIHASVVAEVHKVCNVCPLRNNITAGGCCGEECPVHQVGYTINRAGARTTAAVKEIYRQKFRRVA